MSWGSSMVQGAINGVTVQGEGGPCVVGAVGCKTIDAVTQGCQPVINGCPRAGLITGLPTCLLG